MYFILKLKPKPQIFNFRQKYDNFDGVTWCENRFTFEMFAWVLAYKYIYMYIQHWFRPHKIEIMVLRPNFSKIDEGGQVIFFPFFIGNKIDKGGFYLSKHWQS